MQDERPRAAPRGFPYPHLNMQQVKREWFYEAIADGLSEEVAASVARMTPEQADAAIEALLEEAGEQAA